MNYLCISKSDIIRHPGFSTTLDNLSNATQVVGMHRTIVKMIERESQLFLSTLSKNYSSWNVDDGKNVRISVELQLLVGDSLVREVPVFKPYQLLIGTSDSLMSIFSITSSISDSTFDLQYKKPLIDDQIMWRNMMNLFKSIENISQGNFAIVKERLEVDFQTAQTGCKFVFDDKCLYSKTDSSWRSITFWPTFVEKVGPGCGEIGQVKK